MSIPHTIRNHVLRGQQGLESEGYLIFGKKPFKCNGTRGDTKMKGSGISEANNVYDASCVQFAVACSLTGGTLTTVHESAHCARQSEEERKRTAPHGRIHLPRGVGLEKRPLTGMQTTECFAPQRCKNQTRTTVERSTPKETYCRACRFREVICIRESYVHIVKRDPSPKCPAPLRVDLALRGKCCARAVPKRTELLGVRLRLHSMSNFWTSTWFTLLHSTHEWNVSTSKVLLLQYQDLPGWTWHFSHFLQNAPRRLIHGWRNVLYWCGIHLRHTAIIALLAHSVHHCET